MEIKCGERYEMAWTGNSRTADLAKHNEKGEFVLAIGSDCEANDFSSLSMFGVQGLGMLSVLISTIYMTI